MEFKATSSASDALLGEVVKTIDRGEIMFHNICSAVDLGVKFTDDQFVHIANHVRNCERRTAHKVCKSLFFFIYLCLFTYWPEAKLMCACVCVKF